jgi:imidazolonepropionase-like amidohydrolase
MQIAWPRIASTTAGRGEAREAAGDPELKVLEETFDQAERYRAGLQSPTPPPFDARLAALVPVLERKIPVVASAFRAPQIRSAVAFAKHRGLKLIIYGGYEALECQEILLAEKIPVIVAGVYRLPARRDLPYDDAYTLPARLAAAGIPFCIATAGRFGGSTLRNLPYHAATAAAYGLEPAAALRAITLSAAEIFGVQDRVGALAPGLDATLFIADDDILETPTQVTHAFMQGRAVDLSSKHTQLYKKYSQKYERMK